MADNTSSNNAPPPPSVPLVEEWSSISQGNLGLKAVYWTDERQTALISRDVIGWITYTSRKATEVVPNCGCVPVVLGPNWFPALPGAYPNYVGVVPLDTSDQDVLDRVAETRAQQKQKDIPPTGRLN